MESRTLHREIGLWAQRGLHSLLPHAPHEPHQSYGLSSMPPGPTCVCIQAGTTPSFLSRLGRNCPRDLEPEATSVGQPVWDFSSAGDGHCAQLILKAQLGGGSSGHRPQPPEVSPLEPRPRGPSWQWIARGSVRTTSQRVRRAVRRRVKGCTLG